MNVSRRGSAVKLFLILAALTAVVELSASSNQSAFGFRGSIAVLRATSIESHIFRIEQSRGKEADNAADGYIDFAITAAFFLAIAIVAALLTGAFFLWRISDITNRIERLNGENRESPNLKVSGRGEFGRLESKLNQLLNRVNSDRARWVDERDHYIRVFRTLADAVLLLDAEGVIRFCNDEALTRLGLPGGGLAQGKELSALLPADHPIVGIFQTAKASGSALHDVAAEVSEGDTKLSFRVSVFPLSSDLVGFSQLVIVREFKPVHQFENVVDYSNRLARVGGLVSGVAHQIRNPLNAMTLELELLSQDARDGKPVDDRVRMVRDDMLQLAKAIDALTRFMRPENLKPEFVAANEFMTEAAKAVSDPLIEVVYHLDPSNPAMRVDRAVLMEAFRNVIQNAIEAMPHGGKLALTTSQTDGFIDISFADTGCGIPPDILDRVLHLYFTTKDYGTGLGLPMALRAVDLHGGFLSVDSRVNAGTEVKIKLPVGTGSQDGQWEQR